MRCPPSTTFICPATAKWDLILHSLDEEEVAEATEDDERHHPVQRVDRDDHKVNVKWPTPHVPQIQRIQAKCSVGKLPATGRGSVSRKPWNNKDKRNKWATCNLKSLGLEDMLMQMTYDQPQKMRKRFGQLGRGHFE